MQLWVLIGVQAKLTYSRLQHAGLVALACIREHPGGHCATLACVALWHMHGLTAPPPAMLQYTAT